MAGYCYNMVINNHHMVSTGTYTLKKRMKPCVLKQGSKLTGTTGTAVGNKIFNPIPPRH